MQTLSKEDIRENVVANFKFVRYQLGLNQLDFAKMSGIPCKTIGAIEEGRAVTAHHVYTLSRLINVSMDTIYTLRFES